MKLKQRLAALLCAALLLSGAALAAPAEEGVRVAFLDSGISLKHLDERRVEAGENFVFPDQDTTDRVGHGTATAGLVLGSEDMGLPGVCPTATAVPLVCYDTYLTGTVKPGDARTLALAVRAAVDTHRCRIINISMGTVEDAPELREAVAYAQERGAIVVSAVGNDNLTAPERVYYPAAYEGVIGVGAAEKDGAAPFSQRTGVDVLAPGVGLETATNRNSSKSELRSGTSYACAWVSGLCAAIWTKDPDLTAEEVTQALYALAEDVGEPGFDRESGWGVVKTVPAAGGTAFADLDGHWAGESIAFCVERGLFTGVSADRFDPEGTVDRATLAVVLHRLAGKPAAGESEGFSDVAEGLWYTEAVAWAAEQGIVRGDGGGSFVPDAPVERQQAAAMLCRYAAPETGGGEEALSAFADGERVAPYARAAMSWACGAGILQGRAGESGPLLDPGGTVTRAQLAAMLARLCAAAA